MMTAQPAVKDATYNNVGVIIPNDWGFERWEAEARYLQRSHQSMLWWIGDLFLWGEEHFGEEYAQAVETTYSPESVATAMRVCRAFPPPRRIEGLGFSMHQAVYTRPVVEQDEFLTLAKRNGWRREQLREEIRSRDKEPAPQQPEPDREIVRDDPDQIDTVKHDPSPDTGEHGTDDPQAIWDAQVDRHAADGTVDVDGFNAESAHTAERLSYAVIVGYGPEGSVTGLLTAEQAADVLRSIANANLPRNISNAIGVVLDERRRLLAVAESAERSLKLGHLLPSLGDAIEQLRRA